jgi:cytochrome c oxidase cbb3-type subunit II
MSRSSNLFTGMLGSFAVSCFVLVLVPQMQIAGLTAHTDEEAGTTYPVVNTRPGRDIYIREGCYYCHTQQVRDPQNSADIARGWGSRRTVARDYIYETPPLLGALRMGPDLTNVGSKDWRNEPKEDPNKPKHRDRQWHLLHLYNPREYIVNSKMPPYRYLFEEVKAGSAAAGNALPLKAGKEGYVVVPKTEALQLADYLLSLDRTAPLPETSAPKAAAPAAKK